MSTTAEPTTSHPQRDKRTWMKMWDQHGRPWGADIDITGKPKPGPVSFITPAAEDDKSAPWSAPLMPDQKYLRFNPDRMMELRIDYTRWKGDLREAREFWVQELNRIAVEMSPHDAGASLIGSSGEDYNDASPALLRKVGPKPQAIEPVIAAEQGNSWILGKTTRVDIRLKPFFPDPVVDDLDFRDEPKYMDLEEQHDPEAIGGKRAPVERPAVPQTWNEFLAEQRKAGKTMQEASALWNEKKAAA